MPSPLPRLAFGESHARCEQSVASLTAAQRVAHRSLKAYAAADPSRPFEQKSVVVQTAGIRLAASSHTPVWVEIDEPEDATEVILMVPFHGWGSATIEGREYRWRAGSSAMMTPSQPRRGAAGLRSTLSAALSAARLEQVMGSIAPDAPPKAIRSAVSQPQLVPLTRDGVSFSRVLRHICGLVDACLEAPQHIHSLGIEEMLYHATASMLMPAGFAGEAPAVRVTAAARKRHLDTACEFIHARLFQSISVEDVAEATGLKLRTLQAIFLKQYGCSPRQWILRHRLDAARERLEDQAQSRTVTSVALECGFAKVSSFTKAYLARFGERPRETVARRTRS